MLPQDSLVKLLPELSTRMKKRSEKQAIEMVITTTTLSVTGPFVTKGIGFNRMIGDTDLILAPLVIDALLQL
jgi:hypothetical protein